MTARLAAPVELTDVYLLISGVAVVARGDDTVQIGTEPEHSLLLAEPPPDAVSILQHLDGSAAVADVLRFHEADPVVWQRLLTGLRDAHLLVAATDWSFPGVSPSPALEPERDSLVHRHGIPVARRVLQARQDAVVFVRGSGRIATAVASSLAVSGVGHVHQQPDRALRLADLPGDRSPGRGSTRRSAGTTGAGRLSSGAPSPADTAQLAGNLRRVAPTVKVHRPAQHHRVDLAVLAGDGPPPPSLAAELTQQRVPHLAVRSGLTRAVVGPFVLPGRSSCLACAGRHRAEIDPGRADWEDGLRLEFVVPPEQLVCMAAALAVADALAHLDGVTIPSTLDGTVEWVVGQLAPRRRSWVPHPDCGCRRPA